MSLDPNLKSQLAQFMGLLENPVTFQLSLGDCENSKQLKDFVTEIAEMSDKISIVEEALPLTPSLAINRANNEKSGIVFAGVPMGHEFESFVLALLHVGGRAPKISDEQVKRIQSIDREIHFETIVSLSCHNCPEVVQSFNIMSVLNPNISHTMIEGGTFQSLVEERGIMAVPTVFSNGEDLASGRLNLDQILDMVAGPRGAEDFGNIEPFDVLIIGGGPAGAASAVYAARKGVRTGLIADEFGGQVTDTLGIENIIGILYTEGPKFMGHVKTHVESYGVEIIDRVMVDHMETEDGIAVYLNNGAKIETKTLIIATGARWKMLGIPGEVELRNKGVAYCTHCDGPLFKGKTVAVIGGGNSGVEAAIDLAGMVKEVIVLEFMPELKADDVLQDRLRSLPNVKIVTNAQTTEISGTGKVNGITYVNRETGETVSEAIEGCFIQVGLVPNTEWVGDEVEKNPQGEILVDKYGATNIEGVYAAGDCTDVAFKQIMIASGSGATAALGAFQYLIRQ